MRLILASQSRARADLLRAAGYRFAQIPSTLDEPPPAPGADLIDHLAELARRKARAVAAQHPAAWVLGADTALALDGHLIGKPRNLRHAAAILGALAGRTHRLSTAVCIIGPHTGSRRGRQELTGVDTACVALRKWPAARIRRHVATLKPLAWAGAYALQEQGGAAIVAHIDGDPSTVIGLPMPIVDRLLIRLGYRPAW